MFKKFLKEEEAQINIGHVLIAAGIIVSTIFILAIYSSALEAIDSCVDHPECPE
jgi:hypothetical protein